MKNQSQPATSRDRIYWLDNLRTFMIFLVIVLHAGLVYESSGIAAFFWIVDDPSTNDLSGILNLIIDIFVMSTIFFISGFLAPQSLKSKRGFAFLKSKFNRLIIPWFIAVLTLIPLYKVIFLYSRNLPQEHWTTYFHWSNGIWNQNWLWFLPVLFLFNALYFLFSRLNISLAGLTLRKALWTSVLIAFIYGLFIDVLALQGWTKTFLLDFQNERILIYFLVFLLGSLAYERRIFESDPQDKKLYVLLACTGWIPVNLYLFLVIYSLINPGNYLISRVGDLILIRGSFILSLICLIYLSVNTFRYWLNKGGRISRELNANSYHVYIIHTIVLGVLALALVEVAIPSLVKHLTLAITTYVISNVIVSFCRIAGLGLLKQTQSHVDRPMTQRGV